MRKAWSGHERVKCENKALSRRGPGLMKYKRHEDATSKDIQNILKTADEQSLY